jgi:hypothetical protein
MVTAQSITTRKHSPKKLWPCPSTHPCSFPPYPNHYTSNCGLQPFLRLHTKGRWLISFCFTSFLGPTSIGNDMSQMHPRVTEWACLWRDAWFEFGWNFGSISLLFSDYMPEMVQRRTSGLCCKKFDRIQTRRLIISTLSQSLWGCLKRDNSKPTRLTGVVHVKHVGSKRVMHRVPQPIT